MHRPSAWVAAIALAVPLVTAVPEARQAATATQAWVAEPKPGETTATVSLTLENPGMYALYIVSASSDVAGKTELREAGAGGATAPAKEVLVDAYSTVELSPAGIHVVLSDLKRPLKAGETIDIALTTDGGVTITAKAEVRAR